MNFFPNFIVFIHFSGQEMKGAHLLLSGAYAVLFFFPAWYWLKIFKKKRKYNSLSLHFSPVTLKNLVILKQAELMSGFIEFCVELKSSSEEGATLETDGEASLSQQQGGGKNGRGGRRGRLRRQSSVVCSRVHSLNTISYVDTGKFNGFYWPGLHAAPFRTY